MLVHIEVSSVVNKSSYGGVVACSEEEGNIELVVVEPTTPSVETDVDNAILSSFVLRPAFKSCVVNVSV